MMPRDISTVRLAACTVGTRSYLAQVRTLIESFFEHEPDGHFYLFINDDLPPDEPLDSRVHVMHKTELAVDDFDALCFEYGPMELSASLKPFLLQTLVQRYGERYAVYLDSDMRLWQALTATRTALATANIVLTPHLITPTNTTAQMIEEKEKLLMGVYNAGYVAVRATDETLRFLDWWAARTRHECSSNLRSGLFLDQKWLDLAPGLFDGVIVLRDPTYNVARWNLQERNLTVADGRILVNGQPLTLFHYSGLDVIRRDFSRVKDANITIDAGSALRVVVDTYARRCVQHGFERLNSLPFKYRTFDNGIPIDNVTRHLYLALDETTRRGFGRPFATAGPDTFFNWATTPSADLHGLTPFLAHLYRVREDVAAIYPDLHGEHRAAFVHWAQTHGMREHGYDPRLVTLYE